MVMAYLHITEMHHMKIEKLFKFRGMRLDEDIGDSAFKHT